MCLEYLRCADENGSEYVDELIRRGGKDLEMTQEILRKATEEEILRERALAREKFLRDKLHMENRYNRGLEEGREEGRMAEKREIAKNFRNSGIPIDVIAKNTGLTIEEIEKL